jgi:hypothetical protein
MQQNLLTNLGYNFCISSLNEGKTGRGSKIGRSLYEKARLRLPSLGLAPTKLSTT